MKKLLGWAALATAIAATLPSAVMAEHAVWLQDEKGSVGSDTLASTIQLCGCAGDSCCGNGCASPGNGACGCNSCCDEGPLSGLLGRILRPSDHCFDGFISPMTNPFFFEDPRTLTEARLIFAHHNIPAAVAGGGSAQLYAMQVRLALTERLSVIANKDGFLVSSNPVIRDGWADIAAGLKYNLIRDVARQRLLSVGATYELPTGSPRTFQGNGDGEFNLFYSGARRLADNFNWLSGGGIRIPADDDAESSSMYLSNHFDVRMTERFYLLTEVNWFC